jgi:TolB-like protein/predicted Ser/Thr protein kinase
MIMEMKADDPGARATPGGPRTPQGGNPKTGLTGRRVGVYEILEELGRGGMGVVYRAKDRSLDREVAIKVLLPDLSRDEEFGRRFVREARAAAKLDHPNIVQVYTAGRYEDVLFIAMQLVKGQTLAKTLRDRGRLPVREALKIVRQSCEALAEAHKGSLVHRDIKPNNIMIDETGRVKIMDFGLMRSSLSREAITRSGEFFGTPEYASPEQCETSVLDGRSDLYSLGTVLYEMLAGRMPYAAETPMSLFKKILEEEPPSVRSLRADVPPAVEALVRRMMAKKREERFASAAEVVAAIDRILAGATRAVPAKRGGHGPLLVGVAAAAVLALAAVVAFRPRKGPEPAPVPAVKPEKMKLVVFDLKSGIPQPDTAWYEIALSDMLIASLSQQPFLEVPTRDMLLWKLKEMQVGGPVSGDNRRVLTHELGAQAYLSGTYYVQGGKVRVTLSCYRLPENTLAFPARSFDRSEKDLFSLVDEVAAEVGKELQGVASGVVASVQVASEVKTSRELALAFKPRPEPAAAKAALAERKNRRGDEEMVLKAEEGATEKTKSPPAPEAAKKDTVNGAPAAKPQDPMAPPAAAAPAPGEAQKDKAGERETAGGSGVDGNLKAVSGAARAAGTLRGRPGEDGRRRALATDDESLAKAWYQNRQALEKYRFGREEFEALSATLHGQFLGERGEEQRKLHLSAREGLDRVARQGFGGRPPVSIEFSCPDCPDEVSPSFGPCPKCGKYLIVKVRVEPAAAPEKKE